MQTIKMGIKAGKIAKKLYLWSTNLPKYSIAEAVGWEEGVLFSKIGLIAFVLNAVSADVDKHPKMLLNIILQLVLYNFLHDTLI